MFTATNLLIPDLSADPDVEIQVVSYGYHRAKPAYMAAAVYPAAQMALDNAGITASDVKAIKTHNPFAANDIYLADKLGVDVNQMNNYGCSLIFGHPQGPTAGRLIIEGIEEVVMAAGGYPGSYAKGDVIDGLPDAENEGTKVFHAGTALADGRVVTAGGRVLCATALGDSVAEAQAAAYKLAEQISWDGMFCRHDIGYRAIAREQL